MIRGGDGIEGTPESIEAHQTESNRDSPNDDETSRTKRTKKNSLGPFLILPTILEKDCVGRLRSPKGRLRVDHVPIEVRPERFQ